MINPRSNPSHVDSYQNALRRAILQFEHDYFEIESTQNKWKVRSIVIECNDDEDGDHAFRVLEYGKECLVKTGMYGFSIGQDRFTSVRDYADTLKKHPEKRRQLLIDAGIVDPVTGKLTKEYNDE